MLDIGTGSGILSLVAAKVGIPEIVATDIDPLAVKVAHENIQRNLLQDRVKVMEGNLLQAPVTGKFNLVVANIIANTILSIIPELSKVLESPGYFLASGIINERFPEVEKALAAHGFTLIKTLSEDGWIALVASNS